MMPTTDPTNPPTFEALRDRRPCPTCRGEGYTETGDACRTCDGTGLASARPGPRVIRRSADDLARKITNLRVMGHLDDVALHAEAAEVAELVGELVDPSEDLSALASRCFELFGRLAAAIDHLSTR